MPIVSARYSNPENTQVNAVDGQGRVWSSGVDSQVGQWLEYIKDGGTIDPFIPPTPPTTEELNELDLAELNRILLSEGSVMRGVMELILIEINKLRADHTRPPYTMIQFLTALQKQMRTHTP